MSMRAMLLAVRDHLREPTPEGTIPTGTVNTGLGLKATVCEICFNGAPAGIGVGEMFVAVHPGNWSNNQTECLDETFEVNVTVSVRLPKRPQDFWGAAIVSPLFIPGSKYPGLLAICESIRATLHCNYAVMDRANAIITSASNGTANGFVEPLFFSGCSPPDVKGGSWWEENSKERYSALAQTVRFQPCRRVQRIDIQT